MELPIELDAASPVPLHRQLYEGLRQAILGGRIARGSRLPSTRTLAESLGVSRSTIVATFADLLSEGYLRSVTGSGTYVSAELPDESVAAQPGPLERKSAIRLSRYGRALAEAEPLERPRRPGTIDFRDGRPALDAFPHAAWWRALARAARAGPAGFDYSADAAGYEPLRAAIAAYLGRARGISCDARAVTIVNGSQQGIDLLARLLIDPGDVVAVEEPGYPGAAKAFAAAGAELRPIVVDDDGLRVDVLARSAPTARLVYVTPSHQFPLGVVLSSQRRRDLLRWAEETGALVVEDDYDSAYRYEGRPIPALRGLDRSGRVAYVGTFSKTMFPALRIGYLVVPPALRDAVQLAKAFADRQAPLLEQRALAAFLADGSYERHLRRMRLLYRSRRSALVAAIRRSVEGAEISGDSAGMHVVVRFPVVDTRRLVDRALRAGIALSSTAPHHLGEAVPGEFIFGFADHDEREIDAAIERLGRVVAACR